MYKPYDYQESGINACVSILTSNTPRKEIVISPTGGGKSLYIAFAASRVDFPLIILQPSKELLEQNYSKYIALGGKAEIYSASLKTLNIGTVTFATIGSIKNKVDELKKLGVKAIIIDEAHLGTKKSSDITKFVKDVGIKNVLGLTATPIYLEGGIAGAELKMMNRVRGSFFKDIAHVTQIKELVDKGFWSKLIYKVEKQNSQYLELNSNGSDYTLESQKHFYRENQLESKIYSHVKDLIKQGRKSILIFVPSIEEAESLSKEIPGSRYVHSKMKPSERTDVVNKFKTLQIQVVINVNILSVGFDHPQLDAIITARSTNSIAIYYQQIGRGVRIHKDKKDCVIVDLSQNYFKFGLVEDLNFEKIEGWGWGMFTKNILLSNYPMDAKKRPTKESLIQGVEQKRKKIFEVKSYQQVEPVKLWFGKYNGKTLEQVHKENDKYLPWVIDNFDFNGDKMKNLEKQIKLILNL